jgi:hypothetical protein
VGVELIQKFIEAPAHWACAGASVA